MKSLLEDLQGLIERTYDLSTGIEDVGAFVIGDEGLRVLYGDTPLLNRVPEGSHEAPETPPIAAGRPVDGSAKPPLLCVPAAQASVPPAPQAALDGHPRTARTLVRQEEGALRLTLYYPDALIAHLEAHPPLRALDERNVDEFAVFVEEVDHVLHIAHRLRAGQEITLLELEWQANLTKALMLRHLLARRLAPRPLGRAEEHWVRYHLFEKFEYGGDEPEVAARYREAARLAVRTLDALELLDPPARLASLRAFAHRSFPDKLRSLAA